MESSAKILVVGGVGVLLYAFLIGFALSQARKGGAQASRYLLATHMGGIMEGTALLALVIAVAFADLSKNLESIVAWLLVGGAIAVTLGDTVLWRTKAVDSFVSRGAGFNLQSIGAVLWTVGLAILAVGVIRAL